MYAAYLGHLEMLKWARENGCRGTSGTRAAWGGHLEVLEVGARERLPVDRADVRERGEGRPPRGAEVGARERLPVGRGTHVRGEGRPPRCAEVGAERLPVDEQMRGRGGGWPPRCAEVGARERLPVGPAHGDPCDEFSNENVLDWARYRS